MAYAKKLVVGLAAAGAVVLAVRKNEQASQTPVSLPFVGVAHAKAKEPDFAAIRKDIGKVVDDKLAGPLFVRLSWHASGTYSKEDKTGGSNGANMRFAPESQHGANAGLGIARDLLEPIKKKHPEISYADLWNLAAVEAISSMGGPEIPFRWGRVDYADASKSTPDGRLPDATKGADHIRAIFYRMGFNDREITALIGAHTLGECHKDRSGFVGPWTRDPYGFGNQFFVELLNNKWRIKKGSNPSQYEDEATGELMMLPSDMAFLSDPSFRQWVELYAKDEATFSRDFAAAFQKLQELGCSNLH
eukprot:TRINITY_DN2274_c0_g1_i2.p2 TRINITY_DN2274_c0_g1~~TRINITY_DN2274_c0_g1_i2.p2  ORF type:complete len:313 (-),score=84.79 TRINITY_DN2274_c0_g1_i2:74-985(-)